MTKFVRLKNLALAISNSKPLSDVNELLDELVHDEINEDLVGFCIGDRFSVKLIEVACVRQNFGAIVMLLLRGARIEDFFKFNFLEAEASVGKNFIKLLDFSFCRNTGFVKNAFKAIKSISDQETYTGQGISILYFSLMDPSLIGLNKKLINDALDQEIIDCFLSARMNAPVALKVNKNTCLSVCYMTVLNASGREQFLPIKAHSILDYAVSYIIDSNASDELNGSDFRLYFKSHSSPQNYAKAYQFLEKNVDEVPVYGILLGDCHRYGRGVVKDRNKANKFYLCAYKNEKLTKPLKMLAADRLISNVPRDVEVDAALSELFLLELESKFFTSVALLNRYKNFNLSQEANEKRQILADKLSIKTVKNLESAAELDSGFAWRKLAIKAMSSDGFVSNIPLAMLCYARAISAKYEPKIDVLGDALWYASKNTWHVFFDLAYVHLLVDALFRYKLLHQPASQKSPDWRRLGAVIDKKSYSELFDKLFMQHGIAMKGRSPSVILWKYFSELEAKANKNSLWPLLFVWVSELDLEPPAYALLESRVEKSSGMPWPSFFKKSAFTIDVQPVEKQLKYICVILGVLATTYSANANIQFQAHKQHLAGLYSQVDMLLANLQPSSTIALSHIALQRHASASKMLTGLHSSLESDGWDVLDSGHRGGSFGLPARLKTVKPQSMAFAMAQSSAPTEKVEATAMTSTTQLVRES